MTELAGDLEGIGLSRLIKLLSDIRASGVLSLAEAPFSGKLTFDEGQVCGAKFGTEEGLAALEAIALTLGPGRFEFTSASTEAELHNLDLDGDATIRELDRLAIEAERYRRVMPPLSLVPVPKRSSGPQDETVTVERGSLDLLLDCDGRTTVADLVQRGSMLNTLKRLSRLIELGLIECRPFDRGHSPSGRHETEHVPSRHTTPGQPAAPAEADALLHAGLNRTTLSHDGPRWKWRRGQVN